MPLVKIEIERGFGPAYHQALLDEVHDALVECIHIPENDRRQRLYELDPAHFEHDGRSNQYVIIEITMFKGRSFEAKKALYASIVKRLEYNPGIPGNDITIVIHEPELGNWGIRGGKPASEVELGFDLKV